MCTDVLRVKPDLVITEKGVSDLAQHYLMKAGVSVIRRVRKSDNNRIARFLLHFTRHLGFCIASCHIVNSAEWLHQQDTRLLFGGLQVQLSEAPSQINLHVLFVPCRKLILVLLLHKSQRPKRHPDVKSLLHQCPSCVTVLLGVSIGILSLMFGQMVSINSVAKKLAGIQSVHKQIIFHTVGGRQRLAIYLHGI